MQGQPREPAGRDAQRQGPTPAGTNRPAARRRGIARAAAALAALVVVLLAAPVTSESRAGALFDRATLAFDALDPAMARAAAPALAEWIRRSRAAAIAAGVEPIPGAAREALAGYVPAAVLDAVRWCVDCGDALSLQRSALRLGRVPAVTLGDVIVFASSGADVDDPALWAHELRHVMQYAEWGVDGFAERYLAEYGAVEHEAAEFRWQWMKQVGDPRTVAPAARAPGQDE